MWLLLLISIIITPLVALAASRNQTETKLTKIENGDLIANKIYQEISPNKAEVKPMERGSDEPKSIIVTKTQNTSISVKDIEQSGVTNTALKELIRRESGGRLYVINSEGACGLGQSLPCSKMLNWIGVSSLGETTYQQQVDWMMYYITNRYGTPENALEHHNLYGWY